MSPRIRSVGCVQIVLLLASCFAACAKSEFKDATEVIIVIDSDEQLKETLATIKVEVLDEEGDTTASTHDFALDQDTQWPLSFGVYQPSGGAEWFRLVTRGLDAEGDLLVENKAIVSFGNGRTTREIKLSSSCAGNFCTGSADQTCNPRTGECETVTRSPTTVTSTDEGGISGDDDGGADAGAPDAETDAALADAEADGALPVMTDPVPPSLAGVTTFGGRRTDGTITVYDDGFEQGARICTADGQFCVTGGFAP